MPVEFFKAKNGSDCAKANNIFLHSNYNPQTEAERFAQSAAANFIPQTVIVIEGALGYCAEFLRKRFPAAKIGTIRLCADFASSDKLWDFVLNVVPQQKGFEGARALSEQLYNLLGEEGIFKTLFLEWPPSARAFAEGANDAWKEIKAAIEKSKAVLGTREYFGKRWLKNKAFFFSNVSNTATLERIEKPVIICASGPSLAAALPLIKKIRQNVFVTALSSALITLLHNDIIPDLCFSTDGGYWAKKHLEPLLKTQVPLALTTEASCDSSIFESNTIIPLCYDDDALSKKIFAALELPYMSARRNGTVSGTALEFFLANTNRDIFFAGLDLAPGATFAHTQPNALEINAAQKDFRLAPKATRIARAALHSPTLDLYAQWFANYSWNGNQKVYRIRGKEGFKNILGKIEDIEASAAEEKILENNSNKQVSFRPTRKNIKNIATIVNITTDFSATPDFTNELFPTDSILASRAATSEEKQKYENIILQKTQKLLEEIFRKLK